MRNSNAKKIFKLAILALIISILSLLSLLILSSNGIYVQIGTPPNGISHKMFSNLFKIVAVVSLVYLCNHETLRGVVAWVGIFFIVIPSIQLIDADYTSFSSPDNKEHFVVIERGYGRVYQLSKSGLYMVDLAHTSTNNGYKPFSDRAYQLRWEEPNKLIIHYKFYYMTDSLTEEISIKYKTK